MTKFLIPVVALAAMGTAAFAEGDAEAGEKTFKKCKACHMIVADDGTEIFKGGKTGPNLYGIIGKAAGSQEGFKYGKSLAEAGANGLVWDAENIVTYMTDPKAFLKEVTGDAKAKSKMSYKLKKGGEDVAAYLASVVQ